MNLNLIVDYANTFLSENDKICITEYPSLDRLGGEDFFIKNKNNPDVNKSIPNIYDKLLEYINFCHDIILENEKFNDNAKQMFIELKEKHMEFIKIEKDIFTIQDYINDFELYLKKKPDQLYRRFYYKNRIC